MIKAAWISIALAACATGGSQTSDANNKSDATAHLDGHNVAPDDAKQFHDARPLDAFVPQDAPDGPFCSDNTGCGTGTCCLIAVCLPGTPIGTDICIPDT